MESLLKKATAGDCYVVLTAGMHKHISSPLGFQPDIHEHFRAEGAALMYHLWSMPMVVSGGKMHGTDVSLSAVLADHLHRSLKVAKKDLMLEEQSLDTTQNAVFSAEVMKQKGLSRPVVVTSGYHLKRALQCFSHIGMDAEGIAAEEVLQHLAKSHHVEHYLHQNKMHHLYRREFFLRCLMNLPGGFDFIQRMAIAKRG